MSRQTIFTLSPYSFMICSTVGSTRLQNGHWKSENSWMTTFAFGAALAGLSCRPAGTSFFSGGGGPFASFMISS